VNKAVLVCLLILLWRRIGAQPQRDVGRLPCLPYYPYQIVAQGVSSFVSSLNFAEKASNWRYTTCDARIALEHLHPSFDK
jgi:hypothetical protein